MGVQVIGDFWVAERPGLSSFLKYAAERFDIFVYTFAGRRYAQPILDRILPDVDEAHRLYKDSCFTCRGGVYKDLDMLGRDLGEVIMIEDNGATAAFYPRNTIVVPRWKLQQTDTTMTTWLPELLEWCTQVEDVRPLIESCMLARNLGIA
jgi:TFIIF-interacting CTD phosphatase-like protein